MAGPEDRLDITPPTEGFSTLAAQFTGAMMARATAAITKMKEAGAPEAKMIGRLREELRYLDDRSLKLVYNKALGGSTQDDFTAEQIAHERETKPGTHEIDLKEDRKDISLGSVIQFKGQIYTVARLTKTGYVIKLVK